MTENFPGTAEKNVDAAAVWACPTCLLPASMPYCERCGERKPNPHELTLAGLCKQAFEAFTSYDSRLLQTFRRLVFSPGYLTLMYLNGSRKPYLGPFALFLLANVLFATMETLTGSSAFSTPLAREVKEEEQPWSSYAQTLVAEKLDASGMTFAEYEPVFDQAVAANGKSLIFLMVLPLALLARFVSAQTGKPFAAHLAFSLHFYAFMLTLISCIVVFPWLTGLIGGPGLSTEWLDKTIFIFLVTAWGFYLYLSARTFYQPAGIMRVFNTLVLVVAAAGIYFGYRFLLFVITLSFT